MLASGMGAASTTAQCTVVVPSEVGLGHSGRLGTRVDAVQSLDALGDAASPELTATSHVEPNWLPRQIGPG